MENGGQQKCLDKALLCTQSTDIKCAEIAIHKFKNYVKFFLLKIVSLAMDLSKRPFLIVKQFSKKNIASILASNIYIQPKASRLKILFFSCYGMGIIALCNYLFTKVINFCIFCVYIFFVRLTLCLQCWQSLRLRTFISSNRVVSVLSDESSCVTKQKSRALW